LDYRQINLFLPRNSPYYLTKCYILWTSGKVNIEFRQFEPVGGIIPMKELDSDAKRLAQKEPASNIGGITGLKNPMLSENISKVVRWYKGRCSYEIHKIQKKFEWQERYWDSIILDEVSFHRISNYIITNPENWETDTFYKP
jgi:hypothetical protein